MRRPKTQLRLLGELALVCGSPVLVLALVLAAQLRGDVRQEAVEQAVHSATIAVANPLAAEFRYDPQPQPVLDLREQRRLTTIVTEARAHVPIDRVIVRDEAGKIVFADDPRLIDKTVGSTDELGAALGGRTVYGPLGAADRPPHSTAARETAVWTAPTSPKSNAPPPVAVEMWLPTAALDAVASDRLSGVYIGLAAVMLALWVALVFFTDRATSRLTRTFHSREQQALSDSLTGLPNRARFQEALVEAMSGRKPKGAVILMDLDRFKDVNDTLGHHNGDLLLERIASRLRTTASSHATVARLGGDEFAVLLPGTEDRQAAAPVARNILKILEEPVVVGGLALQVDASLGIALYPENGQTPEAVLRAADVAMYIAKEQRSGHEFYEASRHEHRHDAGRLALIGELRRAMDEAELILHFQPKVDVRTGGPAGFEALARWNHPERGMLSPAEFIPLAERSNLLRQVTLFLIDSALRQCSEWRSRGFDVSVAVNLSMQNMLDLRLPQDIEQLLKSWRLPEGSLELELTESTIMADHRRAQTILQRLARMGVRLSIDDFGTGYSSLAYLKDLAVSAIKIDRSFVMSMEEDESNATIVESTIELGHNLGLEVVAEGVETVGSYERLRELGCDYAQGYFLSRPLAPDRATIWLDAFAAPATGAPATTTLVPDLGGALEPSA